MAHHKSALKRIRQSQKKRLYNREYKKKLKEAIKAVRNAENIEEASEKMVAAKKILDKVSARRIVHKNTAANKKSKLAKYVNSLKVQAN
jgi:small subunit ribosomal protein S20